MSGANISDKGMQSLAGLTELRKLNLLGTRISDESAEVLGKFRKLEELDLYRTRISNLEYGSA